MKHYPKKRKQNLSKTMKKMVQLVSDDQGAEDMLSSSHHFSKAL